MLYKSIYFIFAISVSDHNLTGSRLLDLAVTPGPDNCPGIRSSFPLHSCLHQRSFRMQQRNCLSLHIRSHQRTIMVVMFYERNEARGCTQNLLRVEGDVINVRFASFYHLAVSTCY